MKLKKDVHLIKQFLIEADYYEESTATQVQELILNTAKRKLAHILEDSCNRYGNNQLIRIRKITLDLGDISEEDIETKLPKLFEKKIEQILSNIKNNTNALYKEVEGVEIIEEDALILNYFTHYVKYGSIPWNLQYIIEEYSFNDVFLYLIEKNDLEFQKELFDLFEYPNVRRRLVRYFDSGEIEQFFKKSLPPEISRSILGLRREISSLISRSGGIESTHKSYLITYLKEFLLMASARYKKTKQAHTIDRLTQDFVEFVSYEKDISPLKWIPAVIIQQSFQKKANLENSIIVKVIQKFYTDYLIEEKSSYDSKKLKLTGNEQFFQMLKSRQPVVAKYLIKSVESIVSQISKIFPETEKPKLEQVVQEAVSEIIPDVPIDPKNLSKWIFTIGEELKKIFGVKIKLFEIEFDIKDFEVRKEGIEERSKDIVGREKKEELEFEQERGQDRKQEGDKDSEQERDQDRKQKGDKDSEQVIEKDSEQEIDTEDEKAFRQKLFNISIARDYLSLFIKSGLLPFKKLYKDPAKELKNLFVKYLVEEEGEVRKIIREYWDELVLWRVKVAFGEDFLADFEKIVRVELEDIVPEKIEYDHLLLLNLIRTGTFPWAEIAEKGYDELIRIIENFIDPELKEEFIQMLVDEEFFKHEIIIKKVFAIMSVEFGKELLKIRNELLSKGILDLKTLTLKDVDYFEEGLKEEKTLEEKFQEDVKGLGQTDDVKTKESHEDLELKKDKAAKGIEKVEEDYPDDEKYKEGVDIPLNADEIGEAKVDTESAGGEMILDEERKDEKGIDIDINKLEEDKIKQDYDLEIKQDTQTEEGDIDSLDMRIVDRLADLIVEFSRNKFPPGISQKKQANYIFDEILKAARKAMYETAAMLVSLDKIIIDALLVVFNDKQRDYIKKLVRNYRARFVSIAEEIKEGERREEEQNMMADGESGEAIFIENAGIVLLNPYFKRLFSRLELLDKNEFKSDESREKAAYILQYLVKRDDNPEEFELALNKIIVGMPLYTPIKSEAKITDEEKELCNQLLNAVVKNWGALKNTSRDGFRASFLMRSGRLKKEGAGWRLRVEKKPYDILMSKLPWGYTMIQLPWMKKPLYTEWEE